MCNFAQENQTQNFRMKQVGYINMSQYNEHFDHFTANMNKQQSPVVHVESGDEQGRPKWKKFINELSEGDTAIIQSFTNAFRNHGELIFFLKLCSKKKIRLISLEDNIDTSDELFDVSRTSAVFEALIKMSSYRPVGTEPSFDPDFAMPSKYEDQVLKRHRAIINMYNAGFKAPDIMIKLGYKSASSIFRVLRIYEIEHAYPAKVHKKKKKESENPT